MAREDDYAEEGYPLAPLLLRISAAAIDFLIYVAISFLLLLFLVPGSPAPNLGEALGMERDWRELEGYLAASGLMETEEADGVLVPTQDIVSDDWEDYERSIRSYYFDYQLLEDPSLNPSPHPEWAKERWYNVNVLGLPESEESVNRSELFSFGIDEETGSYSLDVRARIREDLYEEGSDNLSEEGEERLFSFYYEQYGLAQDRLTAEEFYQIPYDRYTANFFLTTLLGLLPPVLLVYLFPPLVSRRGATPGKMIFRLGLLRYDGLALSRWFLLLRPLPFLLTVAAAVLMNDLVVSATILLLMFLVSLALAMVTPKRRALHDYVSLSVVTRAWASDRAHDPDFLEIVRNGPPKEEAGE